MDRLTQTARGLPRVIWDWKRAIVYILIWYVGLVYTRDELDLGELYLLASGFWLVWLIGFSPREAGELSAYAHFNANGERLFGDLDPRRAGRELTGQSMFESNEPSLPSVPRQPRDTGTQLGRGDFMQISEDEDQDLQRALLMSLREEREARKKQ